MTVTAADRVRGGHDAVVELLRALHAAGPGGRTVRHGSS